MSITRIIFLAACLCSSSVAFAQELIYDAFFRGDKVGYLKVSQQQQGSRTTVKSETVLHISMVLSVDLRVTFESIFEGGNLIQSVTESYRDGELSEQNKGFRSGAHYHVDKDGHRLTVNSPRIEYSVTNIHWIEPKNITQVYSERWGEFLPMEKLADGGYGLHLPSGEVNYYRYSGNIATYLKVNHGWFSMEFKLRP